MIIIGIAGFLILVGLLFLFRSSGRLGTEPSPRERSMHTTHGAQHREHPRADGLN